MNKLTKIIFQIGILLISQTAFSQTSPLPEQTKSWPQYESDVASLWKIQNKFLDRDSAAGRDQMLDQLLFFRNGYELTQIPPISSSLLKRVPSQTSLTAKSNHPYYKMATAISPNHYANSYFLCEFFSEPTEWLFSIKNCQEGLKKELASPGAQLILLSKISYQIFWTIVLLLLVYFVFFIHKFLPFTLQYYSSSFFWMSPVAFGFLVLMISLLILFTFGWLFFFIFIYIFLWRFPPWKEKCLLLTLICLVLILPQTFVAPALNKQFHEGIMFDVFNAETTLLPSKFADQLNKYATIHSRDPWVQFELGMLEKKIGNLEKAREHFTLCEQGKPDFFKTSINLANLKYEMGDLTGSEEDFKKIIEKYPGFLTPYINLSQIYTMQSRYIEGEDYLSRAKKINEDDFKILIQQLHGRNGKVRLIYENLHPADIRSVIYDKGTTFQFYFDQFFNQYFPQYSQKTFYYALLITILFSLIYQFTTHTRNFYLLYATREKNIETATLQQLKEYPTNYKKFFDSLERKNKIKHFFGWLVPGYLPFDKGSTFLSFIILSIFLFFLSGIFIESAIEPAERGFPWKYLYIAAMTILMLSNTIFVRIQYGKKKN